MRPTMQPQGNLGQGNFNLALSGRIQAAAGTTQAATSTIQATTTTRTMATAKQNSVKTTPNDLLGFDVFADFKKESTSQNSAVKTAKDSAKKGDNDTLVDLLDESIASNDHVTKNGLLFI